MYDIIARLATCDFPPKNLYFSLPQESMRTTFHYPESPFGRTHADVITKISWMDSLPNYLSYSAPLSRASRALRARKKLRYKYFCQSNYYASLCEVLASQPAFLYHVISELKQRRRRRQRERQKSDRFRLAKQ